jgi:cytochrome c oxidase cbb3-type subunit 2
MSDLAAAAAALGLPEALVERSAEARAAETGQGVDELYAAWAGGEAAPAPSAPPEEAPEASPGPEDDAVVVEEEAKAPEPAAPATPEIRVEVPEEPESAPEPTPAGPYRPPVLVGARDNPMAVFAGVLGLFVLVFMVGVMGPSIPDDAPGARTSEIAYTDAALEGQQVYLTAGCASCHTQMVRPVVADVGLGPVTLADTNQVLGFRRFGPDLSDVGSRITGDQIEAIIGGLGEHPALSLGSADLDDLVAYLEQSSPPPETDEEEES